MSSKLVLVLSLGLLSVSIAPQAYKRVHQKAIRQLLRETPNEKAATAPAVDQAVERLPEDPETAFVQSLLALKSDEVELALQHAKRAIELGLPSERFLAGPQELTAGLASTDWYQELAASFAGTPIHGPLVGQVTDTGAQLWIRTVSPCTVTIAAGESRSTGRTTAASDRTVVVELRDLIPNTEYRYTVSVANGDPISKPEYRFRTAPKPGSSQRFTFAFGGGAGFVPPNERVWKTIGQTEPELLVLMGDNVYIDDPKSPGMQRYCYYRRQSRSEFRELVASTPTVAIWDDHDFGTNDCWGGPALDEPAWKIPVWQVFRRNWANPVGPGEVGCFFRFVRGDVEFFMLDGRYFRTDPKVAEPSMLGPDQLAWLLQGLEASTATFKVVCSPVPWTFRSKGDSKDTWNGYRAERGRIFDFLAQEEISGVVLLSADRHRSDAWKIEREGSYDLYEFSSSRLTNEHVHPVMKHALFSYNEKQSFGLVTIDTTLEDPTVVYRVLSIDGEEVHSLEVALSQLR